MITRGAEEAGLALQWLRGSTQVNTCIIFFMYCYQLFKWGHPENVLFLWTLSMGDLKPCLGLTTVCSFFMGEGGGRPFFTETIFG